MDPLTDILAREAAADVERWLRSAWDDVGRANPVEAPGLLTIDQEDLHVPFTEPENPTPVRAKFYVSEIAFRQWGTEVKLAAVTRGDDNKEWSAATPAGNLSLTIKNELAVAQFAPGQEWYLDMIPVPKESVGSEGMGSDVSGPTSQ